MTPSEIIEYCEKKGIILQVEGEHLRFNAPAGAVTTDIRNLLKENKAALVDFLQEQTGHLLDGEIALRPGLAQAPVPASFAQERLWFLNQLDPESTAYLIPQAFRLHGDLNYLALEQSLNTLVARHESLRTTFQVIDGTLIQVIAPSLTVPLTLLAASPSLNETQDLAIQQQVHLEAATPFELAAGPLLRASLLPLGPEDHVFLLTLHHIISDGWSNGILLRELGLGYRAYCDGHPLELPALPIQYADYSVWQRQWLHGERLEQELHFWESQLAGAPILSLPTDRPRPPTQTHHGTTHPFTLSAELTTALHTVSRQEGCTLFMILLAALQTLLHRYTRQDDVVVGSPIAGRTQPELEGAVGLFINTLVLRTRFSASLTFREVLQQVRDATLNAYAHQLVPFEQLLGHLKIDRNPSYPPLFQVLFVLQNLPPSDLRLPGLTVSPIVTEKGDAMVDVTFRMIEENGELHGRVKYNTDLFDGLTIRRMVGHFEMLLASLVAHPSQRVHDLPLLTDPERQQLLVDWNQSRDCPVSPSNVVQRFEQQVAQTPDATALVCADAQLSYAVLNAKANQLAHHLHKLGVGPDARIGLCLERSVDLLIGLWGILKAGGAYVPLDPSYPPERLRGILHDAHISILVSHRAFHEQLQPLHDGLHIVDLTTDQSLLARHPTTNLPQRVAMEHLAYLIYTSGSTGKPKGVMIPHGALVNYVETAGHDFAIGPQDRVLQFASISFDASAEEIYPCFTSGGTLVLRPDTLLDSWPAFIAHCETAQLTVLDLPTAVWHELVANMEAERLRWPAAIRVLIIGGEQARAERLAQWHQLGQNAAQLINTYGPTEGTIVALTKRLRNTPRAKGPHPDVPLGAVIPHVQAYVVDQAGHPVPIGVTGECLLGGRGLARGYLNSPGLTATKFQPDPFSVTPGARLYRTGDLMRYSADGLLHFMGRADHQVKLRGFRIELAEIEAALTQQPAIQEAVVLCREDTPDDKQVVAYVVPTTPSALDLATIRADLKTHLPEYMVPGAFVILAELPLTPNGKIDKAALPAPMLHDRIWGQTSVAPRNAFEALLVPIWQDILKVGQVGIHDNFFELGGHSLLATQVVSRVRALTHTAVSLRTLFDGPTIAQLASTLETQQGTTDAVQAPPLCPQTHDGPIPLSFAQQRLWFLDQFEPASTAYLMPYAWRLHGHLEISALESSLSMLVARQESLRTIFPIINEHPVQVITPLTTISLPYRDLAMFPESEIHREVQRLLEQERQQPMNLATGPLWRTQLLHLGPEDHVLFLTLHHIISDGWSMAIFFRDLQTLYTGHVTQHPITLSPLPVQYADYAVWQRQWLVGDVLERQLTYWRNQLAGAPSSLELPMTLPRPPRQTYQGKNILFTLPSTLTQAIKNLSQQEGVTVFMTLLAAFFVLVFRHTNQRDLLIGTPIGGRTHTEVEDLIGFFVNTIVLRMELNGQPTFQDVLHQVRTTCLEAYANQDVPFEKLVEVLKPVRDPSRHPFFQVMFQLHHADPSGGLSLPPLNVIPLPSVTPSARFDLWLGFIFKDEILEGTITFNTDLFETTTITALVGQYQTLLAGLMADSTRPITDLPLLTETERQQVLVEWNPSQKKPFPTTNIQDFFEVQVARTPDAIAVIAQDTQLSYSVLNQKANQLAHYLRRAGVGPEVRVGVCLDHSVDLLVSLWAILKAQGVYVPLDPLYPSSRLAFMIDDAQVAFILTHRTEQEDLPPDGPQMIFLETVASHLVLESTDNPPRHILPHTLAYLIYTSGSSGRPKGVMVSHHGLSNVALEQHRHFHSGPHSRVLQFASVSFDASLAEIIMAQHVGGTLIIESREALRPGPPLLDTLRQHAITLVTFPPSLLAMMPHETLPALTTLLVAGEACPDTVIESWSLGRTFLNLYGPTEGTIWSTAATFHGKEKQPTSLGQPIAHTTLYILDAQFEPVPMGIPGEAVLGGIGLARGYLNHPALTAQQFVPDPFSQTAGARLYKTGDRVRYQGKQRLAYLGRIDQQVKLRGHRIELGEIEAVLNRYPSVQHTLVLCREETPGEKQLVAYLVLTPKSSLNPSTMRKYLQTLLPDYMIPTAFVILDEMPLTLNGKVNRQALPAPSQTHRVQSADFTAPSTPLEELVATVWREILHLENVSIHDNFFELGGHSLLATQLIGRVNQQAQIDLPLQTVFDHPILADQASTIEEFLLQEMIP